mgnify:CR=1 FL=1
MKTKLKTILIILIMIMMIVMLSTTVKAVYSATIEMVPDKTNVKPGDTVSIAINLVDLTDSVGTDVMEGNVEYDENFFEGITASSGSWMNNGPAFNLITSSSGAGLTQDGEFAVLQLKVKENATGSSTVRFTGVSVTDGTGVSELQNITLTFTVSDEEDPQNPEEPGDSNKVDPNGTQGGNNDDNNNNGVRNNGINSIRGNSSNGAGSSSGGTSKSQLPKAGLGKGIIIGAGILILITAGSYFLYKKYQKI